MGAGHYLLLTLLSSPNPALSQAQIPGCVCVCVSGVGGRVGGRNQQAEKPVILVASPCQISPDSFQDNSSQDLASDSEMISRRAE